MQRWGKMIPIGLLGFCSYAAADTIPIFGDYSTFSGPSIALANANPSKSKLETFPAFSLRAISTTLVHQNQPLMNSGMIVDSDGNILATSYAQASLDGFVHNGSLSAKVATNTNNTGLCTGDNRACSTAAAQVTIGWQDTVRLLSLTPGDGVDYGFGVHTHLGAVDNNGERTGWGLTDTLVVQEIRAGTVEDVFTIQHQISRGDSGSADICMDTNGGNTCFEGFLANRSDVTLSLTHTLGIQCASLPFNGDSTTCLADALGTSFFTIDPLTNNSTYITGSGLDYRTDAQTLLSPEPSCMALAAGGLLSLAAIRLVNRSRTKG